MEQKSIKTYCRRVFLNKDDSPSTGSVVAFDGVVDWGNEKSISTFLSVSDCHVKAKLHKADYETIDEFIHKMELLRDEIDFFVNHLKTK